MRRVSLPEAGRALVAGAATTGLALALASAVPARVAAAVQPLASVETLVLAAVVTAAALAAAVLAAGSCALLLTTVARATGRRVTSLDRTARALTPALLRRVVAAGAGAGLGLGGAFTATATEPDLGWQPTAASVAVVDATLPQATADLVGATAAGSTATPARPVDPIPLEGLGATRTVRPGDTLWALAADRLGADATDAQVAAAWPRWYEENQEVIGADPHLLRPGQVLRVPAGLTADAPGTTR